MSSDFARAASTAEYLQRATGAPLSFEPLVQERDFGDRRGTPYAELGLPRALRLAGPDLLDERRHPLGHVVVDLVELS